MVKLTISSGDKIPNCTLLTLRNGALESEVAIFPGLTEVARTTTATLGGCPCRCVNRQNSSDEVAN